MKNLLAQISNRSVHQLPTKNKYKKMSESEVVSVDKENVANENKAVVRRSKKEHFVKKQNDSTSADGAEKTRRLENNSTQASSDIATNAVAGTTATIRAVSLADICGEEKLSLPVLRYYAIQIALKLQALHDRGLIHGNLRLDTVASKNSQLVLEDLHSECHVGDFFGSKLTSSTAVVPPEMLSILDTEQEKQYRKYWKPTMDDDISVRLTIGPINSKRIEEAIKSLQSKEGDVQVKSPLQSVSNDQSSKRHRDWKATIDTSLEGMKFEDLPAALSSASNSNEFAKQWRRMTANSRRWAELEPRPSSDSNQRYVAKLFNDFDGCDKLGSVLSELLPYELVEASTAIDMWGMGTMLYEMIVGRPLLDLTDSSAFDLLEKWGVKTCAEKLESVEDIVVRDLLSSLLANDPSERPKSVQHLLQHAFFAAGDDEAKQEQNGASPAISLLKDQTTQEEVDHEESFSWYEQGRFPLCDSDGEGLAPEEELKRIKSNNTDLRNALQDQNRLMGQMAKTNYELQNLLAHQMSVSAEKDAVLKNLHATLGEESEQRTSEALRLLKVHVADMEHTVLEKIEESDLLSSVDSSQDEGKSNLGENGDEAALREENDKLQKALCERNTLMEQMDKTNQDLQDALSQQMSLLTEKDGMINALRASLESETERNREACETIRILEAQVADMQENCLSTVEEEELRATSQSKTEVEMLQKLVEEQTRRLNEQKNFVEELEQAVKEREEKAEERKETIINLKEKLSKERNHCKKVIKAQGRIIDDLKKGLKTHKEHLKDNAAMYRKQLKDVQTKRADLSVALNHQTKFMDKMAKMNKDLQKKLHEQEQSLTLKDNKLRSLEYSLSSDDMSIKTASTTEASIAAEELRRDLVNMVNSKQQIINERDEKIKELYDKIEDMTQMKEEDGEHVKRSLQEASLRYAEAVAQLKTEAEANQRANVAVVLASVPTVAICAVYAMRQWRLGC